MIGMFLTRKGVLIGLLTLLCAVSFYVRHGNIIGHLPYIGHVDEMVLTGASVRIINTGDFNPKSFIYPSLPIYLNTLAFTAGLLREASLGAAKRVGDLGTMSYPFYTRPLVVLTSKELFAFLSVLAIFLTGILAFKAFRMPEFLILPPVFVSFSGLYMSRSWTYLNVDIVGAFFVVMTLTCLVSYDYERGGLLGRAVIPGILCGLCVASKYNLFPICLTACLALFLKTNKERGISLVCLLASSLGAFLMAVPFSLLDFKTFINDVVYAVFIYSTGHKGFEGPEGWPQLVHYIKGLGKDYGWGGMILSLGGLFYSFRLNWKNAIILCSFPILFTFLMCTKKVHFLRNMTPVYLLWPIYIALGILAVFWMVDRVLEKWRGLDVIRGMRYIMGGCVIVPLLVWMPHKTLLENFRVQMDSRNQALAWIEKHVSKGSTLGVPEDLGIDVGRLAGSYSILHFKRVDITEEYLKETFLNKGACVLVPQFGYDTRWPEAAKGAKTLNEIFSGLEKDFTELVRFGKLPVMINYTPPVPSYSPAFSIIRGKRIPCLS